MTVTAPDNRLTCWKEKGVAGDASCPRLAEYGHCRNCPVYARAGRSLFDRDIPVGFQEKWAKMLAGSKVTEVPGAVSVIIFRLNDEFLALKTLVFVKALEMRLIHRIPFRTNRIFRGIVNVDGMLLPCVSIAEILGISTADTPGGVVADHRCYPRLMVVSREGSRFVFPVDEVLGVTRVLPTQLQKPPPTISKSVTALTVHVFPAESGTVGLLDDRKMFEMFQGSLAH